MIEEHYTSAFEAWCKWFDDGHFTQETSILIYRGLSYCFENKAVWYIQPNNGRKMCDVDSVFGGFGVAMRIALVMFTEEFKQC